MKAQLRRTQPSFGSSFSIRKYERHEAFTESMWHFHSEYELLYLSDGRGTRHVMNHISHYSNGELILLGPDIPHFAFNQKREDDHIKIVVQMKHDFLGERFLTSPELEDIRKLLERSKNGIVFNGELRHQIGHKLMNLIDKSPFEKLIGVLKVLQELATSEDYESLNVKGFLMEVKVQDESRMNQIFAFVQDNFTENISLETIAKEINLTVPAFCRFFKRMTHMTFTQFLNEYRISHACKLLQNKDMLVLDVAENCGFQTLSHFNKQFLKITGHTPSNFKENKPVVKLLSDEINPSVLDE